MFRLFTKPQEHDIIILPKSMGGGGIHLKYLDLVDLTKCLSKETGCSLDAADKFVRIQNLYFDKTGVNVDPDAVFLTSPEPAVVDDAEMIQFIVENAGMTEPFVRRLADAELEYMKKNGFINNRGEFIPFLKGRNKK